MKNPQLEALKKEAFRKLAEQEAVTVIKGKDDDSGARFALYEMEIDGVKLLLSGAESLIPLQVSLLKAIDDLIKARLRQSSGSSRNSDVRMLSGHPKIYLHFEEENLKGDRRPREGTLSFRLMDETDASISISNVKKIALKIKQIFGKREGYFWEKGKRYVSYNHWELGYKLQILSPSVAKGKKFIEDILSIQGHLFDPARMTFSQNQGEAKAFPANPGKKRVLGEDVKLPERRPDCEVRFQYAEIGLGGLQQKMVIFSASSNHPVDPKFR
ncbi:hypothetical protein [Microcoleus sp. herbarium5]|uniref:hypothetical protein n=1 Tax=Microcoleus sp. herbarium5 TaxID=3055434 RepID=UPI002FD2D808